jgi:hypothetical protein
MANPVRPPSLAVALAKSAVLVESGRGGLIGAPAEAGATQKLRKLMERAEQTAGGAVVNVLAYKGDHVAALEELQLIEALPARRIATEAHENGQATLRSSEPAVSRQ